MIIMLFKNIKWLFNGRPMIIYPGYYCGCCGKYCEEEHKVKNYYTKKDWFISREDWSKYDFVWFDTWGLCPKGCDDL